MTVVVRLVVVSLLVVLFHYISSNIVAYEEAGMGVIMWVQGIRSSQLDFIMKIGAIFGFEFFFVLVPLLAWWGDSTHRKLGASLFTLLLLIAFFASVLKATFTRPRPFYTNSNIADPDTADKLEFSYPSGHAWASTSFFFLAKSMQGGLYWLCAVVASAYTLFSRLYFGVHYPHDLAAGIACGFILLILFTFAERFLDFHESDPATHTSFDTEEKIKTNPHSYAQRMRKLANVPNTAAFALLVITTAVNLMMDAEIKRKQQALLFVPFCLLGFILCRPFIPHMRCESLKFRIIRLLVGIPIIFSLYFIYRLGPAMRPLVAAFVGGWIFCVAPIIFMKLGLVRPPLPPTTALKQE